jgi:hypothetical protein
MWRNAVFSWILGKQAGYASEPIKFPPAVSNFPCCRQKKLNHGRDRPMRTRKFNLIFRHSSSLILTVLLYIAFSTAAHAKELWVDTLSLGGSCSDARAREEVGASTPWCSLDPAGDQAIAGDVVTVRKGTYSKVQNCTSCNDNSVLQVVNSGTSSAWIQIPCVSRGRSCPLGRRWSLSRNSDNTHLRWKSAILCVSTGL